MANDRVTFVSRISYHERMLQCLREKPASEVNLPATFQTDEVNLDIGAYIDHGPVVDGEVIPRVRAIWTVPLLL